MFLATRLCRQQTTLQRLFSTFKPSASLVKELRTITGSPLKDCMKVLTETEGDIEKSKEMLRKRGLADAEKRADRDVQQGLIGLEVCHDSKVASLVQLSCETDFVAKTEKFQEGLKAILNTVHNTEGLTIDMNQASDADHLGSLAKEVKLLAQLDPDADQQTIEEGVKYVISKTQENCQLSKAFKAQWDESKGEVLQTYLHNKISPGIGKIGSIFLLDCGSQEHVETVSGIASTLAMHTAAMKPSYATKEELPEDAIAQVRDEALELAQQNLKEGMPEHAKQKMLDGVAKKAVQKLEKRDVLMEQDLATADENIKVKDYLKIEGDKLGCQINVKQWVLFAIK